MPTEEEQHVLDQLEEMTGQRPVATKYPMLAISWKCATCLHVTAFAAPSRSPAPCEKCGGIFFETMPPTSH